MNIEFQLQELVSAQKSFVQDMRGDFERLQKQVDAIDEARQFIPGMGGGAGAAGMADVARKFAGSPEFKSLAKSGRGVARVQFDNLSLKTVILSTDVGRTTPGVLRSERIPGVVSEARRQLSLIDLLNVRPTSLQLVDFVKITAGATAAEQSPEGGEKHETSMTFADASERIKTIATWIPASRQVLEDSDGLQAAIEGGLAYAVRAELEDQALFGNGTGETLNGLYSQATAFDTALLPGTGAGSWTPIDVIGAAISQVAIANEIPPDFALVNPQDLWEIRMTKDSQGRYILGDPNSPGPLVIFGVNLIGSTVMTAGSFLVGSSNPAAVELVQRMGLTVEASTEHSDYFVKNKIALRAETRVALVTYRPGSFIKGSLTSSPAA